MRPRGIDGALEGWGAEGEVGRRVDVEGHGRVGSGRSVALHLSIRDRQVLISRVGAIPVHMRQLSKEKNDVQSDEKSHRWEVAEGRNPGYIQATTHLITHAACETESAGRPPTPLRRDRSSSATCSDMPAAAGCRPHQAECRPRMAACA